MQLPGWEKRSWKQIWNLKNQNKHKQNSICWVKHHIKSDASNKIQFKLYQNSMHDAHNYFSDESKNWRQRYSTQMHLLMPNLFTMLDQPIIL